MNLYLGQDKVEESVSLLLFFETGMSSLSSPWVQISLVLQAHFKEPSLIPQAHKSLPLRVSAIQPSCLLR